MDNAPFRRYQYSNENPTVRGFSNLREIQTPEVLVSEAIRVSKTIKVIGNAHGFPQNIEISHTLTTGPKETKLELALMFLPFIVPGTVMQAAEGKTLLPILCG